MAVSQYIKERTDTTRNNIPHNSGTVKGFLKVFWIGRKERRDHKDDRRKALMERRLPAKHEKIRKMIGKRGGRKLMAGKWGQKDGDMLILASRGIEWPPKCAEIAKSD